MTISDLIGLVSEHARFGNVEKGCPLCDHLLLAHLGLFNFIRGLRDFIGYNYLISQMLARLLRHRGIWAYLSFFGFRLMIAITLYYILPYDSLLITTPFLTTMLLVLMFNLTWQRCRFYCCILVLLLNVAASLVVCRITHYEDTWCDRWRWLLSCCLLMWLRVTCLGRNFWKLHWVVIIGNLASALLEIFKKIVGLNVVGIVGGFCIERWTCIIWWYLLVSRW